MTARFFCLLLPGALLPACAQEVEFNRDIRPILSDKCFTCHGPDAGNRKTKLRFDIESGAKIELSGGRFSIVPGNPAKSELYRRISADNNAIRMPPAYAGKEKLTAPEIDLIQNWIAQGAKWQAHWSFIPPRRPPIPTTTGTLSEAGWVRNPIDNFVAARLAREGLKPAPEADKTTLLRRVTLDLTGLPPTPEEAAAFLNDASPAAYEKAVDRLLASPRYGERMAFRWMEVARYADTNGYQTDAPREMWRWRDWVIDAFNRNMPFDQFTIEQIAGDLLPHPTLEQRIATAFQRNHRSNAESGIVPEEYRVEYVADRTETTAAVWLGITLGCARCHDHKYDPFLQKDFYRLFAYYNSVPENGLVFNYGNDVPFIKAPTPDQQRKLRELDDRLAAAQREYQSLEPKIETAQQHWERKIPKSYDWTLTDGLVYRLSQTTKHARPKSEGLKFDGKEYIEAPAGPFAKLEYTDPFTFAAWIKPDCSKCAILSHSEDFLEAAGHGLYIMDGKLRLHVTFRWDDIALRMETAWPLKLHEWQHVLVTYDGKRQASGVRMYVNGQPQETKVLFDELMAPLRAKAPLRIGAGGGLRFQGLIADVRVYDSALSEDQAAVLALRGSVGAIAAIPPGARSKPQADKLRFCFVDKAAPKDIRKVSLELEMYRKQRDLFYESIPTLMVMEDSPTPRDTFVLKRGAYDNPGEKVTPGVPAVLPQLRQEWPNNRVGLARWLVDRGNPLTARVTVNRFWQSLFGTGLVKTVQDFGSQGEPPADPELLDWLAVEFMDSGWDMKAIQKTMVMSATYRQSSRVTSELLQRDPENRLLARGPRLRLGPEVIRDQALAVSGLLVEKLGGPSVKPYQPPGLWQELAGGDGYVQDKGEGLYRRSLYTYWKRTVAAPFMINFDSPSRETCTVRETRTNTPLQALDLMNDVTFLEASRKLAERLVLEGGATPAERIDFAYRLVLSRPAKPAEKNILVGVLDDFEKRYRAVPKAAVQFLDYGDAPRNRHIQPGELAAYTAAASLILNLDATITKE
jgi:hypothetical protein